MVLRKTFMKTFMVLIKTIMVLTYGFKLGF